jgi:septal ring-binding cell division protein DamX
VQAVTDKAASAANPTASAGGGPAVESSAAPTSEAVSGASTDSDDGDGFGSEDPVDSQPVDEVDAKMAEFRAWVAGCKTQTELRAGLPGWQAWTRERSDKHSDLRFRKQGELTIAMQDAYGKRKGEVPA